MSLLAGLSQQGDSIAAHNADAAAHGFGVYTVAKLNAFTSANRPTGCVYCSDCLVPEGVGSPVVWNGSSWVCTCSSIPATTDVLTYFRALVQAGKDHFAAKGVFTRMASLPYGAAAANSGTGSGRGILGDGDGISYYTGSTATGYSTNCGLYMHSFALGAGQRKNLSYLYSNSELYFGTDSTASEAFSAHNAFISYNESPNVLPSSCIGFYYDPQNTLSIGSGGSGNWLAVCRSGSVQTLVDTGIGAAGTAYATRRLLEIHATASAARFLIGGVQVANITTNIPTSSLRPSLGVVKAVGTAQASVAAHRIFCGCRYSD